MIYFYPHCYLKVSHHTEIICGNGVLAKFSHMQIKVGLQYVKIPK